MCCVVLCCVVLCWRAASVLSDLEAGGERVAVVWSCGHHHSLPPSLPPPAVRILETPWVGVGRRECKLSNNNNNDRYSRGRQ